MPRSKKSQGFVVNKIRAISGSAIAAARSQRGWTQQDLAARTGIKRETIAYRERAVSVRGDLAAQLDAAFGGSAWREKASTVSEKASPESVQMLRQLMAQVEEIKRHVLIVERNMLYRRRGGR